MKAKSTIRRQIGKLKAIAENDRYTERTRQMAYETYHALRWVIEDVD